MQRNCSTPSLPYNPITHGGIRKEVLWLFPLSFASVPLFSGRLLPHQCYTDVCHFHNILSKSHQKSREVLTSLLFCVKILSFKSLRVHPPQLWWEWRIAHPYEKQTGQRLHLQSQWHPPQTCPQPIPPQSHR